MKLKLSIALVFSFFLFFLPFTKALTLNVGFALKISEVLILLLISYFLLSRKTSNLSFKLSSLHIIIIFFLLLVFISFLVNLNWDYAYSLKRIPSRISSSGDSFLRLVYIFICVGTYFVSLRLISKDPMLLRFWVKGAVIAAIYSWYLFISSALGIPYFKLPGMAENPQVLYGIVRSGTFLEGNFFGLFLILSSSIAFYLKKEKSGWFLLLSVITSLSSISIISSFVFITLYYKHEIFKKRNFKYFMLSLPIIVLGIVFLVQTSFYRDYVYKKITTPSSILTTYNFSKVDRLLTSRIAFNLGVDNPILGVGPYNFGLHYDQYNDIADKVENLEKSQFAITYFKRENIRAIPNNIYLEVWSEYGVIGFFLYLFFLIKLLYKSYKLKEPSIFAGFVALLISFIAFPSFIMVFLWSFLAIPYALELKFYHENV